MDLKIRVFNVLVMEKETSLRRGERGYAAAYPRLSESGIQVCCSVGFQVAAKHYVAAWSASLLRTRGSTIKLLCVSFLRFFYSIV